jgi:hypothetical protein
MNRMMFGLAEGCTLNLRPRQENGYHIAPSSAIDLPKTRRGRGQAQRWPVSLMNSPETPRQIWLCSGMPAITEKRL